MSFQENLNRIVLRHNEIESRLSTDTDLDSSKLSEFSKELSELSPIVEKIRKFESLQDSIVESKALILESSEKEIKVLAEEELVILNQDFLDIQHEIQLMLLPKDKNDSYQVTDEAYPGEGVLINSEFLNGLEAPNKSVIASHKATLSVSKISSVEVILRVR